MFPDVDHDLTIYPNKVTKGLNKRIRRRNHFLILSRKIVKHLLAPVAKKFVRNERRKLKRKNMRDNGACAVRKLRRSFLLFFLSFFFLITSVFNTWPSENNETFLLRRVDTPLPGMGLLLKLLWGDRCFGRHHPHISSKRTPRTRQTQPDSETAFLVFQPCFQFSRGKIFRVCIARNIIHCESIRTINYKITIFFGIFCLFKSFYDPPKCV